MCSVIYPYPRVAIENVNEPLEMKTPENADKDVAVSCGLRGIPTNVDRRSGGEKDTRRTTDQCLPDCVNEINQPVFTPTARQRGEGQPTPTIKRHGREAGGTRSPNGTFDMDVAAMLLSLWLFFSRLQS